MIADQFVESAMTRPITPTERKVVQMLGENTGSHFMDSGMYGRAWQRFRQGHGLDGGLPNSSWDGGPSHRVANPSDDEWDQVVRMCRLEPSASIDRWACWSASTFEFMTGTFEYKPELDKVFQRYLSLDDALRGRYNELGYLEQCDRFCELLAERGKVTELYGDGNGPMHNNTYNYETLLDRTLQWYQFGWEPDACNRNNIEVGRDGRCLDCNEPAKLHDHWLPKGVYTIIQVHGGADVRGGYTAPVLFRACSDEGILDQGTFGISCPRDRWEQEPNIHLWDTGYGGYGSLYTENGVQLYFCTEDGPIDEHKHEYVRERSDIAHRDDEGNWLCPHDGELLSTFYFVHTEQVVDLVG